MIPSLDTERLVRETWIASAEHHEELDSTNDRAKRLSVEFFRAAPEDRTSLPLLITADRQTAGRGRGANRWWTGDGALAATVLIDLHEQKIPIHTAPLLGIAAGVAVAYATQATLDGTDLATSVGLHWPNDVYVGESKMAGILIELVASKYAAIGIGVNVNNTVADLPNDLARERKIGTLRDLLSCSLDPTSYLRMLLASLDAGLRTIARNPADVAACANRLCLQRERMLSVKDGDRTRVGLCQGIASDGALLLKTDAGVERFYAGSTESVGQNPRKPEA